MDKNIPLTGLVMFLILNTASAGAKGLGVNIGLPERGGTFVDMAKEHHRWLNPGDWSALGEEYFDERGWPITDALFLMDLRPVAEWAGEIDDPENYRVDYRGTYKCSFTGNADVLSYGTGAVQQVVYHADENRTTFDFIVDEPGEDNYGFFALVFLNTELEPGGDSGLIDLKIIRPGYDEDTEQTFLDEFIYALTNPQFAAIRFKDFLGTDGADPVFPGVTEWADRKLVTDAAQVHIPLIGKNTGAAWEYVIELANAVEIDPWINIPVSATTEYVTEVAQMFKRDLNPDLNIYVESSNEVWNTAPGYEQTQYSKEQAEALGIGERENHARRTVELAQIFESVYGNGSLNDKIRVVLCSHAPMLKWWVQGMLDYIAENFGDVNRYIYALACQTYYGGGADEGESIEKILSDCLASIDDQMDEPGGDQAGRKQWIAKAAELGLKGGFCSYEGGPDHGGGSTTNLDNRIDAERSQGMADVFKHNIDDGFFQIGGNLAIQFTLTSSYNRYGCWGLTDDIFDPDRNYKFQAARDLIMNTGLASKKRVTDYELVVNYPNPFNPTTTIMYEVATQGRVSLDVYNILGEKVASLVKEVKIPGQYNVLFDAANLSSGIYICRLRTGSQVITRKMLLAR